MEASKSSKLGGLNNYVSRMTARSREGGPRQLSMTDHPAKTHPAQPQQQQTADAPASATQP